MSQSEQMDNKVLYLMRGIPGSGKSTIAGMIADATNGIICSTDDFWYDEDGVYNFNIAQIGIAHVQNQIKVDELMIAGHESIIVDNTNVDQKSMQPYIDMAARYGYVVQMIQVSASFEVCFKRNYARSEDRQVPIDIIKKMDEKLLINYPKFSSNV